MAGKSGDAQRSDFSDRLELDRRISEAAAVEAAGYLSFVRKSASAHNLFTAVQPEGSESKEQAEDRVAVALVEEILRDKLQITPTKDLAKFADALDGLTNQTKGSLKGLTLVGDVELTELPDGSQRFVPQTVDIVILTANAKGELCVLAGERKDSPGKIALPGGFVEPPAVLRFKNEYQVVDASGRAAKATGARELHEETGIPAAEAVAVSNYLQLQAGIDANALSGIPGGEGNLMEAGTTYAHHLGGGSRTTKTAVVGFMSEGLLVGLKAGDDFAHVEAVPVKALLRSIVAEAKNATGRFYSNHGTSVIPIALRQAMEIAHTFAPRTSPESPIGHLLNLANQQSITTLKDGGFSALWDQATSTAEVHDSLTVAMLEQGDVLELSRRRDAGAGRRAEAEVLAQAVPLKQGIGIPDGALL